MTTITYEEFENVNLRSGTTLKVEEFPRAKKPAFKVWADFGPEVGILQTSVQVNVHYTLLLVARLWDALIWERRI